METCYQALTLVASVILIGDHPITMRYPGNIQADLCFSETIKYCFLLKPEENDWHSFLAHVLGRVVGRVQSMALLYFSFK